MQHRRVFLMLVSLVLLADAAAASAPVRRAAWSQVSSRVQLDLIANAFHVEQDWLVTGASREELLEAARHLTLSGRYGVYGDRQLLKTDVPPELQNTGEGVSAWAHPIFIPTFLGSRAGTVPTADGFRASMSGGMLGRGESQVTFTERAGAVAVSERGTYSLAQLRSGERVLDVPFNLGAATFGRVPLALAHKTMGQLHNRMFKPVEAMSNWINDRRAGQSE